MDNATPNMSEKLMQYLDDELNVTEKNILEQQLSADENLQQELASLRSTREAIRLYGLQQKVASIHEKMMEEILPGTQKINSPVKRSARKMVRYSITVAASLLLLIGGYMAYNFITLSPDKVFASRYQPYELITVRGDSTVETVIEKTYREKNYREVIRMHETGKDSSVKTKFLAGAAAMELKANETAINCFRQVLEENQRSGKTLLNDEAEYYLSLAYIRNRNYAEALELLYKIKADAGHVYHDKISSKLIREVRDLKRK